MPIRISRLEEGVYLAQWHGYVVVDDVLNNMRACHFISEEAGEARYIIIQDMSEIFHIPVDVRQYTAALLKDSRLHAIVIIRPPTLARALGRVLHSLSMCPFLFTDNFDNALEMARSELQRSSSPD